MPYFVISKSDIDQVWVIQRAFEFGLQTCHATLWNFDKPKIAYFDYIHIIIVLYKNIQQANVPM